MFCENFAQNCMEHEYNNGILEAGNWIWSNYACIQGSKVCFRTDRVTVILAGTGREAGQVSQHEGKTQSLYCLYLNLQHALVFFRC